MSPEELETLRNDLDALRKAVRRNNPLLRELLGARLIATLSLSFGVFVVVFSMGTQFLIRNYGSFGALPAAWKTLLWAFLGLCLLGGGIAKALLLGKKASSVDREAGMLTVMRAFTGSSWFRANLPGFLSIFVLGYFAIHVGHPWYILPSTSLIVAFYLNSLGLLFEAREYSFAGWYALLSSLPSLFFLERAPWLWLALICGGSFLVLGLANLFRRRGEVEARGAAAQRLPDAEL